ncbi:GNAT family N-acetyltransferase [Chryseobacterium sp.]|uniref:GNAT family N-acetyltransferase n=1 Tax=Chryseobacterium sp. TaxID=1871047 RepID=UPI0025C0A687|nr:GNAT family N-acetyltransferase [Chryseobacterium sp.]
MANYIFTQISSEEIPYPLLLLADETVEAIDKYIFSSEIYVLKDHQKEIAVMALYKNSAQQLEIKNIAVIPSFRNQGIGKILINKAKEIAVKDHFASLIVGTSDTGYDQIRFYEKNGFIKKEIRKDFFIKNYPVPIYENGMQMRDMIILEYLLHNLSE